MMKTICFFSGDITRSGGTERVATVFANGLRRAGAYKVLFLSLVEQSESPFYPIVPEIQRFTLRGNGAWIQPGMGYLPLIPALRRFLKQHDVDILVDIDIVLDALSLPAAAGLPVKVISWEHLNCVYEQSVPYRRIISRLTARFSQHIVTLTERDRETYEALLHRRGNITVIKNPAWISGDNTCRRENLLVTVGRLVPGKGIDMLAQIIPKILEKYQDWKWYFLGDGECREVLEAVRQAHGLEGRLLLPGAVPDVERYLARASVLVLASRSEAFGMCLLEARVCGVPSVAFDVPVGPAELIEHGVNGFLIPPFDLDRMTEKISQLIEDPNMRERFSRAAQTGMEEYRLDAVLEKWMRLFDSI